jgi:hypothetical protein
MKFLKTIVLLCLLSGATFGQNATGKNSQKAQYVKVPAEKVTVAVAQQPDSPLRIEEAAFLLRVDQPGMMLQYTVRNVSPKPVRLFISDRWNTEGVGGTLNLWDAKAKRRDFLQPGEALQPSTEGKDIQIVPLTNDLRRSLLKDKERVIYILVINRVEFADGSIFEDSATSAAISAILRTCNYEP